MAAATAVEGAQAVIACGPPGVELLPKGYLAQAAGLQAAIDLNAVPAHGLGDVAPTDKATHHGDDRLLRRARRRRDEDENSQAAIAKLFTRNDLVLDADEVYAIKEGKLSLA